MRKGTKNGVTKSDEGVSEEKRPVWECCFYRAGEWLWRACSRATLTSIAVTGLTPLILTVGYRRPARSNSASRQGGLSNGISCLIWLVGSIRNWEHPVPRRIRVVRDPWRTIETAPTRRTVPG